MSMRWDFVLKQDDTGPDLEVQLLDEDGDYVNITGYASITFRMMRPDGTLKVSEDGTEVDPALGLVKYVWDTNGTDTDENGEFYGEFHVILGSGQKVTFPNNDWIKIYIYERVPST